MGTDSDWKRWTRELSEAEVDGTVRVAVELAAARNDVHVDIDSASAAVVTTSERRSGHLLRTEVERTETMMLIVGELLVVVGVSGQMSPVVSFLQLASIEIRTFSSSVLAVADGIEVDAIAIGAGGHSTMFIALDDGPDGRRFRVALDRAVAAAHAAPRRHRPSHRRSSRSRRRRSTAPD